MQYPMLLCLSRPSFLHSEDRQDPGFAECGHDRDGPLAVEGRLLSGHEVSRLEGSRGGRQIDRRPARWWGRRIAGRAAPGSCGVQPLAVVIAVAISVMVRVSRLTRTVRRWTAMAGSPRLAAIRKMACSEDAHGSSPLSRACRAASQLMAARGWPVLMPVPAVMVRRKASRCRKCPWLI